MIAKLTSKNQLTLPKAVVQSVGAAQYFEVEVIDGQIVLTPVRIQRGDAVRAKFAELGIGESEVADAVKWARAGSPAPAVAESRSRYKAIGTAVRRARKKRAPRRT